MTRPVVVIGVGGEGPAGLPEATLQRTAAADVLIGGKRLLAHWPDHPGEALPIGAGLAGIVARIRERGDNEAIVVLVSGDPLFYGIAATLRRELPDDAFEIVPSVTSLQAAFARAGIDWGDAALVSAHARPLAEVVSWARHAPKLGVLTDAQNAPGAIAQALLDAGLPDCRAVVAENLGMPNERITDARLRGLPGQDFGPLNVLLLVQDANWHPAPSFAPRSEDAYHHHRELITKRDVRALALARLALRETDTVWDIGAGSGAVSVEMAELAWRGQVFAVERDPKNLRHIRDNRRQYGTLNVEIVPGAAPEALAGLPAPDAVFIGGSGGRMAAILAHIAGVVSPGCRVVACLVTLNTLTATYDAMRGLGWKPALTQISVAHARPIAEHVRLAPENPVFILSGTTP